MSLWFLSLQVALSKALREVLVNTITADQVEDLCELLDLSDVTPVDLQLFSGTAALAERILYPDFVYVHFFILYTYYPHLFIQSPQIIILSYVFY